MIYKDGSQFQGQWKQGAQQLGKGIIENCYLRLNSQFNQCRGKYQGKILEYKPHDNGTFTSQSWNYIGQFQNGIKHGKGKIIFRNEDYFQGEWFNDDQMKGKGVCKNGQYSGEMFKMLPEGQGALTTTQYKFQGNFKNGQRNGNGSIKYNNGSFITGIWKDDFLQIGQGNYISSIGNYLGGLAYMKKQGKGTLTLNNGDSMIGNWHNDQLEGEGKLIKKLGQVYQGKFQNSKKSGFGKIISKNGQLIFEGNFKDDLYHGYGQIICNQEGGYEYKGEFHKGKKQGEGVYDSKIYKYKGQWLNDKFEGAGQLTDKKKQILMMGNFKQGLKDGFFDEMSIIDDANQETFIGNYKNGKKQGQGTLQIGKRKLKGSWKNDKKNGVFKETNFKNGALSTKVIVYDMDKIVEQIEQ